MRTEENIRNYSAPEGVDIGETEKIRIRHYNAIMNKVRYPPGLDRDFPSCKIKSYKRIANSLPSSTILV